MLTSRKLLTNYILRHKYVSINKLIFPLTDCITYRNYNCSEMGVPLLEVVKKLENVAPLKLAESWDNVGLLVESDKNYQVKTILLTIDLTEDIVDEALDNKAQMIVTYHPNIFRPIKSITQR